MNPALRPVAIVALTLLPLIACGPKGGGVGQADLKPVRHIYLIKVVDPQGNPVPEARFRYEIEDPGGQGRQSRSGDDQTGPDGAIKLSLDVRPRKPTAQQSNYLSRLEYFVEKEGFKIGQGEARHEHGPIGFSSSPRQEVITLERDRSWGEIRYVHRNTNLRAGRSTKTKIVGKIDPGKPIRVDFPRKNWFAVFSATEHDRNEKRAIGYVYAPLLKLVPRPGMKPPPAPRPKPSAPSAPIVSPAPAPAPPTRAPTPAAPRVRPPSLPRLGGSAPSTAPPRLPKPAPAAPSAPTGPAAPAVGMPTAAPKPSPEVAALPPLQPGDVPDHTIRGRRDYSIAGGPQRMQYNVEVKAAELPSKNQLAHVARAIWSDGNTRWSQFTVMLFLPGMSTKGAAYGVAVFTPLGLGGVRALGPRPPRDPVGEHAAGPARGPPMAPPLRPSTSRALPPHPRWPGPRPRCRPGPRRPRPPRKRRSSPAGPSSSTPSRSSCAASRPGRSGST